MQKVIRNFFEKVVLKRKYYIPIVIIITIAFGFSAFNPTLSIDDMARALYVGEGNRMISATRWGMTFWMKILSTDYYVPGLDRVIATVLMIFAGISFSCLMYILNGEENSITKYLILSLLLMSYPLINEIWEYNIANIVVVANLILVFGIHIYLLCSENSKLNKMIISGSVLSIVAASYEAGLFVYITVTVIVLFYKFCIKNKKTENSLGWFKQGITYIPPLVIAILLRVIIGILLIKIMGLEYIPNGDISIKWGEYGIRGFLKTIVDNYILTGVVYFPIRIFLICLIVFSIYCIMICIIKKRFLPCLLGFVLCGSLFSQALLQGVAMPYRTAQTLSVFVGFVGYLVIECFETINNKRWYIIVVSILCFVSFRQAIFLNSMLTMNHLRSENEKAVVSQLGYDLQSKYPDKEIVFVGEYYLGEFLNSQIEIDKASRLGNIYMELCNKSEYVETNVNSALNWSRGAFGNQEMMRQYFAYCGFDIKLVEFSEEFYRENIEWAKEYGMKPYEIKDMGSYLIVCIGKI